MLTNATSEQQAATQDNNCIKTQSFGTQALSTTKHNTMISTGLLSCYTSARFTPHMP